MLLWYVDAICLMSFYQQYYFVRVLSTPHARFFPGCLTVYRFIGRYDVRYLSSCRGENNEVDQTRPELEGVLNDGTVNHMRYQLPDNVECDHCILMMRYRE